MTEPLIRLLGLLLNETLTNKPECDQRTRRWNTSPAAVFHPRSTHHVPEMGAESACGLVVLHHAVIVENLPAAVTEGVKRAKYTANQ